MADKTRGLNTDGKSRFKRRKDSCWKRMEKSSRGDSYGHTLDRLYKAAHKSRESRASLRKKEEGDGDKE